MYGNVDHHIPPSSSFCWEASISRLRPRQHPAPDDRYWFIRTILGSFHLNPAYPSNQVHPPIAPVAVIRNDPKCHVTPVGPTDVVHGLHKQPRINILGWEFQFLVPISGTPIVRGIPIPLSILKIPFGKYFLNSAFWRVRKSEFRLQNSEFWNLIRKQILIPP